MSRKVDLNTFLQHITEAVEDMEEDTINGDTKFQELPQWSSISALMVIAMVFSEYNAQLTGEDLVGCQTINDLVALVGHKLT